MGGSCKGVVVGGMDVNVLLARPLRRFTCLPALHDVEPSSNDRHWRTTASSYDGSPHGPMPPWTPKSMLMIHGT